MAASFVESELVSKQARKIGWCLAIDSSVHIDFRYFACLKSIRLVFKWVMRHLSAQIRIYQA